MDKKRMDKISLFAMIVIIVAIPLYMVIQIYYPTQEYLIDVSKAHYVGAKTCIECHAEEYKQWMQSDHAKAMGVANDSSVLGDFSDKTVEYNNMTHKLFKKQGKYFAYTDGEDGKMRNFEIKYVFGYYPLQQYLVEFDKGRLQVLPLTWDSKNKKWYHMAKHIYPNEIIDYTNWLHWTNQAQNWNGMCADCHSTDLRKNYDLETDSFHTTWSEINVSCETCHGPASKHLEWANKPEYARNHDDNMGLVVKTSGVSNEEFVDVCVRCHTRRSSLCDFHPGESVYQHTIPTLPTGENYFIDGQILNEDYVYSSFTQSKMYARDVKCNDCHNMHTTKLLFDDNRLCTQCHRAEDYDTPNHHFHKMSGETGNGVTASDGVFFDVGEGAKCVNCHMPARFYMGVDYRRDHSIRLPRPDLTIAMGVPNACNLCHADKTPQWSQKYIEEWYGKSRHSQYGTTFYAARQQKPEAYQELVNIINSPEDSYPVMVRATAVHWLGASYQLQGKDILIKLLKNSNQHIRFNAINSLIVNDKKSLDAVFDLLNDNIKAIRVEAARKLIGYENQIPVNLQPIYKRVRDEYKKVLEYNADFPTGKFNLANYYYNIKNMHKAEEFYLKALKQDPLQDAVKINLALLYNANGKFNETDRLLKEYTQAHPNDGNTLFTYALFLSEQRRYDESLQKMERSAELEPQNTRILYNMAMMYDFKNQPQKAVATLNKAIKSNPDIVDNYMALLNLQIKYKNKNKVVKLAKRILSKFPNIQNKQQIQALCE